METFFTVLIFSAFAFVAGATRERVLTEKRNSKTGFLIGESARKFLEQMKENENKKVPAEEMERIKKNYEIMKSIIDKSNL